MNKIIALLLIATTIQCSKKEAESNTHKANSGSLQIGFSIPQSKSTLKSTKSITNVAAAIISVTDANGNPVHTLKQLPLLKLNGSYITEPLPFTIGAYKLTSFSLIDNTGNVIYATPVANSSKAYLVSKPLPIDVLITKDAVNKISPEVISTENTSPSDFGYTTFSFNEVKTFDFLIGAFVYNSTTSNFELTTANLSISKATQVIYTETLTAATTKITLPDATGNYTLTISKTGYKTYTATLTDVELKAYLNNPKMAILEKTNLTDGLVAYYPFDGNTNDVIGGNNGVEYSTQVYNTGKFGQAHDFNGTSDYILLLNTLNTTNGFTFSVWINSRGHNGVENGGTIISKTDMSNTHCFYVSAWGATSDNYVNKLAAAFYNSYSTHDAAHSHYTDALIAGLPYKDKYTIYKTLYITLNEWSHCVVNLTNTELQLWINGVKSITKQREYTSYANTNNPTCIGNGLNISTGSNNHFNGLIDDLRIYNRALTDDEILQLYNE